MYVDVDASNQRPARMQRAEGAVRASFRHKAGATRLDTLFQEGCAKLRLPAQLGADHAEGILINTAGGLTGGDRLSTGISLAPRSIVTITTQACERLYRSTGDVARVSNRLALQSGARLAWLPQETILFEGARLDRQLDINMAGDAELIAVEAILLGRTAMGERLGSGSLRDRWRVRRDGKLVFADDLRLSGDIEAVIARQATLGGSRALATVIVVAPDAEARLNAARAAIGDAGGASAWQGKLVVRLVADGGLALRRRLEPLLGLLLGGQPLPKVWQL